MFRRLIWGSLVAQGAPRSSANALEEKRMRGPRGIFPAGGSSFGGIGRQSHVGGLSPIAERDLLRRHGLHAVLDGMTGDDDLIARLQRAAAPAAPREKI